jgi:BNR repeat-containing family member
MLEDPVISVLGRDPTRKHRINSNSFQQNAITSINGWQYAALFTDEIKEDRKDGCYLNLARRQLARAGVTDTAGAWQAILFEDYLQTVDDGHNTISIGVCRGDGTIHIAFDHHCDQ